MWFEPSEPLRTTPQHKETLGEGVLHVFGVVRTLRTSTRLHLSTRKLLVRVLFGVVRPFRTCSFGVLFNLSKQTSVFEPPNLWNYTSAQANLGEGILHVFGVVRTLRTLRTTPQHKETLGEGGCSTLRTSCELHLSASEGFFGTCSVWFLVRVFYTCSVWFDPSEPLTNYTSAQANTCSTLFEGILLMFGVVRTLRTSTKHLRQANTW